MEQNPNTEQEPKTPKELQLTEEELTLLDGFDEAIESDAAARDAWMEAHGLTYGDEVVVKNEGQPDRIYTTNAHDFFTRKNERTLLEESKAAARMFEASDVQPLPEVNEASEQLRIEAAEDLGEEAVGEVIADPEGDVETIEDSLSSEETKNRVAAVEHQFLLREEYTREEISTAGAREVLRLEEEKSALSGVVNTLKIVPDLSATLRARVGSHAESLSQMDGRSMDVYDPNRAFARQVEELRDQFTTVQRSLKMFSMQSIPEMNSSQARLTDKVQESISEVESNRRDFEAVVSEIEARSSVGEIDSSLKDKDDLHNKLAAVMEPIAEIADSKMSIDAKINDQLETVTLVLRNLTDIYDASIRSNQYDPMLLNQIYASLESLGSEDTSAMFAQEDHKMDAAISSLKSALRAVDSRG